MIERLRIEEKERNEKKARPKRSAKASTSSGVPVTLRPKRQRPPVKVQGGTLDTFVRRRPSSNSPSSGSEDQIGTLEDAPKEPEPKKLVQRGLKDFFPKKSMYKDIPTDIGTSDHDSDDDVVTLPPGELIKKIRAGVSHVIFNREGSYFPGLVKKIKKNSLLIKSMKKTGMNTWSWPKNDCEHTCKLNEIYHIIPTPKIANNRANAYFVQKINEYW